MPKVLLRWKLILAVLVLSISATLFSLFADPSTKKSYVADSSSDEYFSKSNILKAKTLVNAEMAEFNRSKFETDEFIKIQLKRQQHLSNECHILNPPRWTADDVKAAAKMADSIFVDDRRKYIYCLVPKVACTSWTRVLLVATGKVRETDPNKISQNKVNWLRHVGKILRPLSRYSPAQIEDRLKTYFKFMFVRHPFERLLSAFRDRVQGNHAEARRMISRQILANHTNVAKKRRRKLHKKSSSIKFSDFVRFVSDPVNDPRSANQHWRPMTELCHPCHINYDFIGHYNTIQTDAAFVINRIGASDRVRFPFDDPDNRRKKKTNEIVKMSFSTAAVEHVTRLKNHVYAYDFKLFGFDWNIVNGTISTLSYPKT